MPRAAIPLLLAACLLLPSRSVLAFENAAAELFVTAQENARRGGAGEWTDYYDADALAEPRGSLAEGDGGGGGESLLGAALSRAADYQRRLSAALAAFRHASSSPSGGDASAAGDDRNPRDAATPAEAAEDPLTLPFAGLMGDLEESQQLFAASEAAVDSEAAASAAAGAPQLQAAGAALEANTLPADTAAWELLTAANVEQEAEDAEIASAGAALLAARLADASGGATGAGGAADDATVVLTVPVVRASLEVLGELPPGAAAALAGIARAWAGAPAFVADVQVVAVMNAGAEAELQLEVLYAPFTPDAVVASFADFIGDQGPHLLLEQAGAARGWLITGCTAISGHEVRALPGSWAEPRPWPKPQPPQLAALEAAGAEDFPLSPLDLELPPADNDPIEWLEFDTMAVPVRRSALDAMFQRLSAAAASAAAWRDFSCESGLLGALVLLNGILVLLALYSMYARGDDDDDDSGDEERGAAAEPDGRLQPLLIGGWPLEILGTLGEPPKDAKAGGKGGDGTAYVSLPGAAATKAAEP